MIGDSLELPFIARKVVDERFIYVEDSETVFCEDTVESIDKLEIDIIDIVV